MLYEKHKYASPQEIADELEISKQTVINYINSGLLKAHKFGGRFKITKEQLQEFLVASENISQTEQTASDA